MNFPHRFGLVALAALLGLSGCASVPPASTVPPTGWPQASPSTPGHRTTSQSSPQASLVQASAAQRTVTKPGFVIPLPDGYLDATALITDVPSAGPATLVAYLRNPGQHAITVQTWRTDQQTLDAFLAFYVKATDAGEESTVTQNRAVTMGGLPGRELTLKSKTTNALSAMFVTMRSPGTLVLVTADLPDEGRRQAVEQVATGLVLT